MMLFLWSSCAKATLPKSRVIPRMSERLIFMQVSSLIYALPIGSALADI
jgi:hypothetical protein